MDELEREEEDDGLDLTASLYIEVFYLTTSSYSLPTDGKNRFMFQSDRV